MNCYLSIAMMLLNIIFFAEVDKTAIDFIFIKII